MSVATLLAVAALAQTGTLGKTVTGEYDVPADLEVKVWAESPQLLNPTNIDVDARGRIWATEGVNYRINIRKSVPGDGFLRHAKGDRVVIVEDSDGDGVADKSKVFVEDPELISPLGIAVIGNKVIVSSSPGVFVYTDTDGDDRSDKREVFLTGFGGVDHDHGVHAVTFGPDGRWYFNAGNDGPHEVKDRAGWTLRMGKGAKSDDGRLWLQGLVMRINPDGTGLRVLAHNFRNNYELAVDAFGSLWQNDNDDDGNAGCRMTWVMEGGSYGYQSLDGRRSWRADQRLGQTTQTAHWHMDDPGTALPTDVTGAGAPTGIAVYEGALLTGKYRGMVLNADAGRSTVWGHVVKAAGAGYTNVERIAFMGARKDGGDAARLFRPSDVAVGLDGAVYVADWYDPMVGGHGIRDKLAHGRIFRITPRGTTPTAPVKIDTATPEGAIAALLSPAVNVRAVGWQALDGQGDAALVAVRKRLGTEKEARARARLLWYLAGRGEAGRADVVQALRDRDADIRMAAFRALRGSAPVAEVLKHAATLTRDRSAAVRREVALALRDVPAADSGKILIPLAAQHDGQDRAYLEAIGIGFDGKQAALWPELEKRLGKRDPLKWSKPAVDLAWRLHPDATVAAHKARAESPRLAMPERQRAVVALAFTGTQAAADAVVTLAEKAQEPLRGYALDLAFDRAGGEWQKLGVADRLKALKTGVGDSKQAQALEALKDQFGRKELEPRARQGLAMRIAERADGGNYLIGLAAQGKLAPELKEAVAQVIFKNPDVGVRALASQYFKRPAFDGVEFPAVPALMKMKGDAERGRKVYASDRAACSRCHEYAGQGGNIGPALTLIAGKLGREALMDSILNPSAAISFGYEPWVITTKDQQTYTGFLVGDGETVLLKEISGETRLITAKDIAQRQREKTSIMPDNIALGMKPQELVDLVEFLASGKKQ